MLRVSLKVIENNSSPAEVRYVPPLFDKFLSKECRHLLLAMNLPNLSLNKGKIII
jgi:hypothetical protein